MNKFIVKNTKSETKAAIEEAGLSDTFMVMPIEVLEAYGDEVMKEYEHIFGKKFIYASGGCCG